jgi:Uma2 family endonuclease
MPGASWTIEDAEIGVFNIPKWVHDLKTFRKWIAKDEELDFGRVSYIQGRIAVDISKEQLYTHNAVKTELAMSLGSLIRSRKLGRYFSDGVLLCNITADIGKQPDGVFVSFDAFRNGRVRDVPSKREGGYVELEGAPDIVIEVVSTSSVQKDRKLLKQAYWDAGIPEYWIIDARSETIDFSIYRTTNAKYVANRNNDVGSSRASLDRNFV